MTEPVDTRGTTGDADERGRLELPPGCAVVAVMARPLVRGTVKRRLAASVGDEEALAVYTRLLGGTLDTAAQVAGAELVLAEAEAGAENGADHRGDGAARAADPLQGRDALWRRLRQRGGALGERLAAVFDDLFAAGADRAILVGSDSPSLPPEYLERGLALLAGATDSDTLVLGPAADGGYYLIGVGADTWRRRGRDLGGRPAGHADEHVRPARPRPLRRHDAPASASVSCRCGWTSTAPRTSASCSGSPAGERARAVGRDGTLREIYLHVTHRCARDCRHCYDRDAGSAPRPAPAS